MARDVHIWLAMGDDIDHLANDPHLLRCLSTAERQRAARFRFDADRTRFITGRVLARRLLEKLGGRPAVEWELGVGPSGRPRVVGDPRPTALDFNIAHTEGLVVCAATRGPSVGIDVEARVETPDYMEIARRFFAPAEVRMLQSTTGEVSLRAFFAMWTLKEALVKALGGGLTIPLDFFAVDVTRAPPEIVCLGEGPMSPIDTHLQLWEPTPVHTMAVAILAAGDEDGPTIHACRISSGGIDPLVLPPAEPIKP